MFLNYGTYLRLGRYSVLSVLGQGGFGITYLVEDIKTKQKYAIKEFYPKNYCNRDYNTNCIIITNPSNLPLIDRLQQRFIKEAENLKKLNHEGIVAVHEVFFEYNTAYFVMDYIEGESLSEMVKRQGRMDIGKAINYITRAGEALSYVHSQKMTHFDIKPGNIMIRRSDERPVLIDFGLSVQYTQEGEHTTTNIGAASKGFSPVEMYNTSTLKLFSPETDVYSLAATLYYLLTGIIPPESIEIAQNGIKYPPYFDEKITSAISNALRLKKDRTQTVAEFLEGLKNIKIPVSKTIDNLEIPIEVTQEPIEVTLTPSAQKNPKPMAAEEQNIKDKKPAPVKATNTPKVADKRKDSERNSHNKKAADNIATVDKTQADKKNSVDRRPVTKPAEISQNNNYEEPNTGESIENAPNKKPFFKSKYVLLGLLFFVCVVIIASLMMFNDDKNKVDSSNRADIEDTIMDDSQTENATSPALTNGHKAGTDSVSNGSKTNSKENITSSKQNFNEASSGKTQTSGNTKSSDNSTSKNKSDAVKKEGSAAVKNVADGNAKGKENATGTMTNKLENAKAGAAAKSEGKKDKVQELKNALKGNK